MRIETLPSDEEISPFCFISLRLPVRVYNLPVHRCFFKVGVLKNFGSFTGKHLFSGLLLIKLELQLCLKAASAQVFSCEIYEIFKNTLFYRTPSVVAFKTPFKRVKDVCLSNI